MFKISAGQEQQHQQVSNIIIFFFYLYFNTWIVNVFIHIDSSVSVLFVLCILHTWTRGATGGKPRKINTVKPGWWPPQSGDVQTLPDI